MGIFGGYKTRQIFLLQHQNYVFLGFWRLKTIFFMY